MLKKKKKEIPRLTGKTICILLCLLKALKGEESIMKWLMRIIVTGIALKMVSTVANSDIVSHYL